MYTLNIFWFVSMCVQASQLKTGTKKAEIWHVLSKNPGKHY